MDRQTQAREMRKLAAAPDYMIGSVQAVTEHGQLVVASASGSQIGPYAAGAGQLILIIGGQKLVPDMQTALQRVTEHVQPYEDQRLREQMGIPALCAASSSPSATTAPAGPPSSSSVSRSGYWPGPDRPPHSLSRPAAYRARRRPEAMPNPHRT